MLLLFSFKKTFGLNMLRLLVLVAIFNQVLSNGEPHPGHLKHFGHFDAGNRILVEERSGFMSPTEFFNDFVVPLRPLIFKGGYKETPAFKLWEDEYLKSLEDPEKTNVTVETAKKEFRDQEVYAIPFRLFLEHYLELPVYCINKSPTYLRKDIPLPGSLQCSEFFPFLSSNHLWMSRGGTNGLVHTDHYDNINCVVRGNKTTIIVDPRKFPEFPMDKSKGSFSTIDVDAVNYTKYPTMSTVSEYYYANVSAGDCLYIPYNFIHQVRSFERNIAVNVFWTREAVKNVDISACSGVTSMNHSLTFGDVEWDEEKPRTLEDLVREIVRDPDPLTFDSYWKIHMTDTFTDRYAFENKPASFEQRASDMFRAKVFDRMDVDGDGEIEESDVDLLKAEDWKELEKSYDDVEVVVQEAAEWAKAQKTKDEL